MQEMHRRVLLEIKQRDADTIGDVSGNSNDDLSVKTDESSASGD